MAHNDPVVFIPTWNGARLQDTLASIPDDVQTEVFPNRDYRWPLAKCWNYAIQKYCIDQGRDSLIVSNDDVLFRTDTVTLLDHVLNTGQWVLPGKEAMIVTGYDTRVLPDRGPSWVDSESFTQPGFFCFCVNRNLPDRIGWFDESFNPAYFEDVDMMYRIKLAGFEVYSVAPVYHYSGTTSKTDTEVAARIENDKARLMEYYKQKWGGAPWHETYTQPFNGEIVNGNED